MRDNGVTMGRGHFHITPTSRLIAEKKRRTLSPKSLSPPRPRSILPRRKPHPERWQSALSQLHEPKRRAFPRSRQTGRLALRTRSRPALQHIRKTQADARIARPELQPSTHPLALSTSTPSRARIPILRPSRTARPALPSHARRAPAPCPFARSRSRRTAP